MATRKRRLRVVEGDPDIVALTAVDAEAIRFQLALVMHHRQLAQQFENELVEKIETTYGKSVRAGGGWSLNTAEGRLERTG